MSEYRKPKNRLFVDEIVSVGVVADGDNPADAGNGIVFYKRRPDEATPSPSEHVQKVYKEQLELFRVEKQSEEPMTDTQETVAEAVTNMVNEYAFDQVLRRFGPAERGLTREQVKAELWKSEEGQLLAALMRSEYSAEPWLVIKHQIRKDHPEHAKAIRMVEQGLVRVT